MVKLVKRLAQQVGSESMAYALLTKRGQMKGGKLTAEGKKREAMGASGRAKDRAAKAGGGSPSDYVYSSKTNRATRKK
jgi:hypothetical protein